MTHGHLSLRERLEALREHGEPRFEASGDPILAEFGRVFAESGLISFDANKHLRTDALSPIYDCWTESQADAQADLDRFVVTWTPVFAGTAPVAGFHTGQDSALLGSTPTVVMPDDERTSALLLLVTSTFVHLSGRLESGGPLVQGAIETDDNTYRFVTLDPSLVAAPAPAPSARE
jgi:hypothetical protein